MVWPMSSVGVPIDGNVRSHVAKGQLQRSAQKRTIAASRTPPGLASGWGCRGRHAAAVAKTVTGAVGYGRPRTSFGNPLLRNGFLGTRWYGAMSKTTDRNQEPDTSKICRGLLDGAAPAQLDSDRRKLRFPLYHFEFQDQKEKNHELHWKALRSLTKGVSLSSPVAAAFWGHR